MTGLYFCPTVGEVESAAGGGFDVCCSHPELHVPMPDTEATAAVSEALSEAKKREFALGQRAEKAEAQLGQVRRYCELTADSCHVPTRQTAIDVLQLLDTDGVAAPATQASGPVDFVTETFGDGSQRTRLDRLTDGRAMCCLCFKYTPREGLEPAGDGSGAVTDVCKPCAAGERQ